MRKPRSFVCICFHHFDDKQHRDWRFFDIISTTGLFLFKSPAHRYASSNGALGWVRGALGCSGKVDIRSLLLGETLGLTLWLIAAGIEVQITSPNHLFVRSKDATETYWCPGLWQWFRTCTREVLDACNATLCVEARAKVSRYRSRFRSICSTLEVLMDFVALLALVLRSPIVWVVVVIAVLAALIGDPVLGWLSAVLWGLVLLYGISWVLYLDMHRKAPDAVEDFLHEAPFRFIFSTLS